MIQEEILGTAPEYLHSKRYGAMYRPAYYHKSKNKADTAKEIIRFTPSTDTPNAVASVLHHHYMRVIHKTWIDMTFEVIYRYMKSFNPWVYNLEGWYIRFAPGRLWHYPNGNVRRPFTVAFSAQRDNVIVPGNAHLFVMILNMGRRSRFYDLHDPENNTDTTLELEPGQVGVFRQGLIVTAVPGQKTDHFGLELTGYWIVSRDLTFLEQCFDKRRYFTKQSPNHYSPVFDEEKWSSYHVIHGLRSEISIPRISEKKSMLVQWTRETFAPFMYTPPHSNFALRELVTAAPGLAQIENRTNFDKATYWDVYYPDYTDDERDIYEVKMLESVEEEEMDIS